MNRAVTDRIQSHVFRGIMGHRRSAYYFVSTDEPRANVDLVGRLIDGGHIVSNTVARDRTDRPSVAVGFTSQGLKSLDDDRHLDLEYVPLPLRWHNDRQRGDDDELPAQDPSWNTLPDPFVDGMQSRGGLLNDPAPSEWDGRGRGMLIWVTTPIGTDIGTVQTVIDESGLEYTLEEGNWGRGPSEVLGFTDGISQPYVEELASDGERGNLRGGGTPVADGWRPVPAGEFVLGLLDAGHEHDAPSPRWLTEFGTFLVYRKYEFDLERWDRIRALGASEVRLDEAASHLDRHDVASAKMMGRWPIGSPFADQPLRPREPGVGADNDFRYAADPAGFACPLGAHIRRSNPRDTLGFHGDLVERHRIIRRGSPWAEGKDRTGLHFVAINARIRDQFEFIQRQWLNSGVTLRIGHDVDVFAGQSRGDGVRFVLQQDDPAVIEVDEPVAELIGGDYFLMPGLDGLGKLAGR